MSHSRSNVFWPLRLIVVLSIAAPALLFSYATWENYRAIDEQANERIMRALDVLQEHALKAFQTVERSISETNEVLRGMSDRQIRASEADLFLRFKRTQQALPQIESIWVFDSKGQPLVSSTVLPVPRDLDISDRAYFTAQTEAARGTYIGEVGRALVGSLRLFAVSGRRLGEPAGKFNGVIGVSMMPEHFIEFYRKLSRGRDSFALIRADGDYLARFPQVRFEALAAAGGLAGEIRRQPEAGIFTTISQIDNLERRIGYRKVPGLAVYVTAGIETAALSAEFWTTALTQFLLGLPAVLAMVALALYALHRARRFQEEETRREIAEAALKQAQRLEAVGQLTGGVAHDFNNLLMIVNGNADRLKRHVPLDDRTRRSLEAIETAVRRGTDLTRQLLSFSRRQTHEVRVIDLKERLPVIQAMLQSSLRGDIAVELRIADELWRTKVDSSEFELALLNLAVNARDAMRTGGQLTIAARNLALKRPNPQDLDGDFVVVSVQDTGAGIAPDVIGRIFEPFFTTKDVGKGTGLGLSQVYGFAQQAGGTATVTSTPGKGTTVTLYLPRSIEPVEADPKSGAAGPAPVAAGETVHVLLVEDNPEVADVTRGFLEQFGYAVLGASDVPSALDILRGRGDRIDLVLTDIVMPGGANGLDLARQVRQERGAELPVILATGYSDRAQAAADEGFTILRKPYDAATLHNAVAEVLKRAGKRQVA